MLQSSVLAKILSRMVAYIITKDESRKSKNKWKSWKVSTDLKSHKAILRRYSQRVCESEICRTRFSRFPTIRFDDLQYLSTRGFADPNWSTFGGSYFFFVGGGGEGWGREVDWWGRDSFG